MIGIFDSGFGGLTVMKEYLKRYPDYDYIYLGDQANAPYGGHSKERISALTQKNVKYLIDKGCTLIIVACNTASADALRDVQQIYKGTPTILGVLVPAAEEAIKQTTSKRVGVIGTRSTVESEAYLREVKKLKNEVAITQQEAPLLVPLVEEGMVKAKETTSILKKYLRPLKNANVDTLILGCTHYPLLSKDIERIMGKNCQVISSGAAAADAIGDYFKKHPSVEKQLQKNGERTYLTTDCPERFSKIGSTFLGEKIEAMKIEIS